ncbi:MAG: hypothetical protein WA197_01215 [Candidatus Acidiferrales bacterium]
MIRRGTTGVFLHLQPDFKEVQRGLRRKNESRAHLWLAFQFCQERIQLIFWNSFAAVELSDPAPNLRVDTLAIFQQPTVLFFLRLQQSHQHFLDAARPSRLPLFSESSFQGRIANFDVHSSTLPNKNALFLRLAERKQMSR